MRLSKAPGELGEEVVAPAEGRSQVFSETKLRNDYRLFFPDDENPDSKSTVDLQVALFEKFRSTHPIDAWEFLLARQWGEWDPDEKRRVFDDLTKKERDAWVRCL